MVHLVVDVVRVRCWVKFCGGLVANWSPTRHFLVTFAAIALTFSLVMVIRHRWAGYGAVMASVVIAAVVVVASVGWVYSPTNYIPSLACPTRIPTL